MIYNLLNTINIELNDYLRSKDKGQIYRSGLADITLYNKQSQGLETEDKSNMVYISLVSIEEEVALKNNYPKQRIETVSIQGKPAVFMNAYLLFTACYTEYESSLKLLEEVILFFQANQKISFNSGTELCQAHFHIHQMGIENLNNLWTVLGGRYIPSIIYKAGVLLFKGDMPVSGPLIQEIEGQEK